MPYVTESVGTLPGRKSNGAYVVNPKIPCQLILAVTTFMLIGCASSAIVTGAVRAPINPDEVKVYSSPPIKFEEVAILEAEATSGWSKQGKINSALAGLRKQAARIGANGVLIDGYADYRGGAVAIPMGSAYSVVPVNTPSLKGRATFVSQE